MNIKKHIFTFIIILLLILSLFSNGYIYGIPTIRLLAYICIPVCIYNGIKIISKNRKDFKSIGFGVTNIFIGLFLFILAIQNKLFI